MCGKQPEALNSEKKFFNSQSKRFIYNISIIHLSVLYFLAASFISSNELNYNSSSNSNIPFEIGGRKISYYVPKFVDKTTNKVENEKNAPMIQHNIDKYGRRSSTVITMPKIGTNNICSMTVVNTNQQVVILVQFLILIKIKIKF